MVSKCANPGCSAPFHYLRDGKVFQLQMENQPGPQLLRPAKPPARVEHFWLCGECAASMTLLVDEGKVMAVPLDRAMTRRAAAS